MLPNPETVINSFLMYFLEKKNYALFLLLNTHGRFKSIYIMRYRKFYFCIHSVDIYLTLPAFQILLSFWNEYSQPDTLIRS